MNDIFLCGFIQSCECGGQSLLSFFGISGSSQLFEIFSGLVNYVQRFEIGYSALDILLGGFDCGFSIWHKLVNRISE